MKNRTRIEKDSVYLVKVGFNGVWAFTHGPRPKRKDITAVCKSKEEFLVMMTLIVMTQYAYRRLKEQGKTITFKRIIAKAKFYFNEGQDKQPRGEKSEFGRW